MIIQSKDDKEDFRGFVYCVDDEGNHWELRSYGKSAQEAADNGWKRYLSDTWSVFGCIENRFVSTRIDDMVVLSKEESEKIRKARKH
jgi:hypothetical protein